MGVGCFRHQIRIAWHTHPKDPDGYVVELSIWRHPELPFWRGVRFSGRGVNTKAAIMATLFEGIDRPSVREVTPFGAEVSAMVTEKPIAWTNCHRLVWWLQDRVLAVCISEILQPKYSSVRWRLHTGADSWIISRESSAITREWALDLIAPRMSVQWEEEQRNLRFNRPTPLEKRLK